MSVEQDASQQVKPAAVIILAAGEGTRMKSSTPKVLHALGGRSLVGHSLAAAATLSPQRVAVVVRHERDRVADHVTELYPGVVIVDQDDIPGTGRAVDCAMDVLDALAQASHAAQGVPDGMEGQGGLVGLSGAVVVLAGDIPLLDGSTLAELMEAHADGGHAVTVLTTRVDDPTGYGRIVRDEAGAVLRNVEHKDASDAERGITEINTSIYVFDAEILRHGLRGLDRNNAQGEVYLPDVIAFARSQGRTVGAVVVADPRTVEGVNDRAQLAVLRAELNRRALHRWMLSGVTVIDPATTWIDVEVELARDVTLLPGTQLYGSTVVAEGATIGPDTTLTDVHVGPRASIIRTHASGAVVGEQASVGPFAYLRPGTVLGHSSKIGTFVETKNSDIGAGSKVPHLSYIGDTTVGEHTNIGAASVTVNYDGVRKYRTVIGSHARTGADNMFVAPVTIGDGAYTGAGSVIRRDVPPGALAVSSGPQRNIDGWTERRRSGTGSAGAAAAARERQQVGLGSQAQAQLADHSAASQADRPAPPPQIPGVDGTLDSLTTSD